MEYLTHNKNKYIGIKSQKDDCTGCAFNNKIGCTLDDYNINDCRCEDLSLIWKKDNKMRKYTLVVMERNESFISYPVIKRIKTNNIHEVKRMIHDVRHIFEGWHKPIIL